MSSSILVKFPKLHKYRPKQKPITLSFCILQILVTISVGLGIDQPNPSDSFAIGPAVNFDHPDASFVESILKLGFFDVAIQTCRDRYRMAEGTQLEAAAQWSMLEMQSVAARVAADPTIIDDPGSAEKLLIPNQAIVDRSPDSPRSFWLKQQQQWCRWLVLRRMQAAYIAVPARKPIREWSLASIRQCLAELETLRSQIQKAPARGIKSINNSDPTSEQWSSLINDTYLLQTDLLLLRALYYPAKSTDRIATATEMLTAIDNAELRISADWPGRPNVELARCAALIHLVRSAEALSKIKSLNQRLSAPVVGSPRQGNRWRMRIASLAAEACRNLGDIKESNQWLESVGGWTVAPEIAIEHFANLVTSPAGQLISELDLANALKTKNEIGQRFGSYWQQRADAILVANNMLASADNTKSVSPATSMLKVELLRAEAKQLLAAKRWNEAVEKLSQAELSAASASNDLVALDIAIQSAAVLHKNGQKEAAEDEFHRAAIAYSKQPKAPDVAIMSILSFDMAVRFDSIAKALSPKDEEAELKQQIYQGRLMDIVNTWPNTTQANQAVSRLDQLFLATDQLPELIALWAKRLDQASANPPPVDPNPRTWSDFDQAISRYALVCTATQDAWYDHSIYLTDAMKNIRPNLDALRTKILDRASSNDRVIVQSILTSIAETSRWPNPGVDSNPISKSVVPSSGAVAFLAYFVNALPPNQLEALMSNLDAAMVDAASDLALKWSITELLFQRTIQAGTSKSIDQTDLANLRICVEQLGVLERQDGNRKFASIGKFQSMQLVRSLRLYRAAIQCWTGDEPAGVKDFQAAIAAEPKTPWWSYRTARLFQTLAGQREQAIKLFRQLANGFPAGSEPWLESRARTVQTMRQLGDSKGEKDVTDLVFATYPAAVKEWQPRFAK